MEGACRSIKGLTTTLSKPTESRVTTIKTPEKLRTPEELSVQLIKIYNELRNTATPEDLTSRVTKELGPDSQIKVANGVIFVRSNNNESWFILPNIGEKNITRGVKFWYRVSEPKEQDGPARKTVNFRLDQLATYPASESPWSVTTGEYAMHIKMGTLTEC